MKPKRVKGRNWSDKETRLFIELCGEYQILSIKEGRLQTNIPRFKVIEEKMLDGGYVQSSKQLQVKFKQLKQLYYRTTNEIQYGGETATRFNYYEEMNALVAAAGSGLINDTNIAFDGGDEESHEEVEHVEFMDPSLNDDDMTFQFDTNVKKESDGASETSDAEVENNYRPKRNTAKRKKYASSSNDELLVTQAPRNAFKKQTESNVCLNRTNITSPHNDFVTQWYKNQSKLQNEFFEEQHKLIKAQRIQLQSQFFEEQQQLQKLQQSWMERMIQNERKNLNEQLKLMMSTFMDGVERLVPAIAQSTSLKLADKINSCSLPVTLDNNLNSTQNDTAQENNNLSDPVETFLDAKDLSVTEEHDILLRETNASGTINNDKSNDLLLSSIETLHDNKFSLT